MQQHHEQIREQQKDSWNKFSPGWKKWDDLFMDFMGPVGHEIMRLLNPQVNGKVLDVAAGTGEPGLSIAAQVPDGKVVITDLAPDMLTIARDNALRRGIHNIETHACDVCELPFADHSFDAISCRFGFMFFPDTLLAAKEMARVLKPGGRIAVAVWNVPEKNFWVTAIAGAINRHLALPAPPLDAPGIFRCAQNDYIPKLFAQAGIRNISVNEVPGKLNCGTTDVYWNAMNEVAAPVVAALSNANAATQETIKQDVYQVLQQKYPDGDIQIESSALVVYGEK